MRGSIFGVAVAASSLVAATSASASVITTLPGGTSLPIPATNQQGTSATQTIAAGITADPATTFTFGWTGTYGFSSNGDWGSDPMIGLDQPAGSFSILFANPISAFLGELNWTGNYAGNAMVAAFSSDGTLLESLTLESGGSNLVAPGFYGFSRSSSEISRLTFSNEFIGVRNITIQSVASVPEPSTWALMLLGFGAVGFSMRRGRRTTARLAAMA